MRVMRLRLEYILIDTRLHSDADAIVLRQGTIKGDLRKANKVQILARNGQHRATYNVPAPADTPYRNWL